MSFAPGPGADSGSREGDRYGTVSALTNEGPACHDRGQPSFGCGFLRRLPRTSRQDTRWPEYAVNEAVRSS